MHDIMKTGITISVSNPISSEEEYKQMWQQDPMVANMLLFFTENMNKEGDAVFASYADMTERLNMRFSHMREYKYKVTIN